MAQVYNETSFFGRRLAFGRFWGQGTPSFRKQFSGKCAISLAERVMTLGRNPHPPCVRTRRTGQNVPAPGPTRQARKLMLEESPVITTLAAWSPPAGGLNLAVGSR